MKSSLPTPRLYQRTSIDAIQADFAAGKRDVVLSTCPGGGKTLMGLHVAEPILAGGECVLVLAHGTLIGETTAERIKVEIGCAFPQEDVKEIEVSGRNLAEGVPRNFTINSNEVLEALHEPLAGITSAVRAALEQTPPELCADVYERGIVLTQTRSLNLTKSKRVRKTQRARRSSHALVSRSV